ncbi:uncharacterized protein TrAFT101_004380 [Trichoderma asperellum]|uniref:uncharacterized protein n=1 Tax=Trichoderma asperellum TaxID=101201 RepID=UPI00331E0FEB|nr:hypothetical protein TrAFT101_004380 [Trichoderma asperellum]
MTRSYIRNGWLTERWDIRRCSERCRRHTHQLRSEDPAKDSYQLLCTIKHPWPDCAAQRLSEILRGAYRGSSRLLELLVGTRSRAVVLHGVDGEIQFRLRPGVRSH